MKLTLSIPTLAKGKGGAERVAAEVANEMAQRGHRVSVYMSANGDERPTYKLCQSIEPIKIPMLQGKNDAEIRNAILSKEPEVFFIFYFDSKLLQQYSWVADSGIPVGAQECTNPQRAVANILKAKDVPDVTTAYNLRRSVLSGMHGIRFTLDSYRDSLPEIAKPYCRTFKNAFAPAGSLEQRNDPNRRKTIINVGGLKSPNKNGLVLARAFALLADDFPDWDLKYFGGVGLEMIHRVIRDNHLEDRIHLSGVTDDISGAYASADMHVICSFQEGCPNVVCEAMLHGLPSVGYSDCSGTNELIQDDVNGLLVNRGRQVRNLADAMGRLMSDDKQRERLGEAALVQGTQMFDQKTIYDNWEALFTQIASYADNSDRLFDEQASISSEAASRLRHLRSRYLYELRGPHLKMANSFANEKVGVSASGAPTDLPLVSFIIPVFNKEAFIEETIESVLANDYPAKEIIAVDDCSSDGCLEILARYEQRLENFHLVRRPTNGGLSRARNAGLPHAKGDFIQFWDADDVYDATSLGKIIEIMQEDGSDIATGLASRDGKIIERFNTANKLRRRTVFAVSPEAYSTASVCFKIYRTSFLKANNLKFVGGLFLQDLEFNLRAFCLSDSISMTPYVLGEYRAVENSSGKVLSNRRMNSSLEIENLTRRFIEENELHHFESFRQRQVLKYSFLFFITKLIGGRGHRPSQARRHDHRAYVEKYRSAVGKLGLGVMDLYSTDPEWALGLLAFASGHDAIAASIFDKQPLPEGFESQLLRNPLGFSAGLVYDMCKVMRRS